jgi:hypothetical protein
MLYILKILFYAFFLIDCIFLHFMQNVIFIAPSLC